MGYTITKCYILVNLSNFFLKGQIADIVGTRATWSQLQLLRSALSWESSHRHVTSRPDLFLCSVAPELSVSLKSLVKLDSE